MVALPKVFSDPKPKIASQGKMRGDIDHGAASNDGFHKKNNSGSHLLKHGLKAVFTLAAGVAIGFSTGVIMDLSLIDYVHYPNEAMQTMKNVSLAVFDPFFEWLGIAGNGGVLNSVFNSETLAPILAPFAPASTAASTSAIGSGVSVASAAEAVHASVESAAVVAEDPPLLDPLSLIEDTNGL